VSVTEEARSARVDPRPLRRDATRAAAAAGTCGLLIALDFLVVRPLQAAGSLDSLAVAFNVASYLLLAPGLLLARGLGVSRGLVTPTFLLAAGLVAVSIIWAAAAVVLRVRRRRRARPTRVGEGVAPALRRRQLLEHAASLAALGGLALVGGYSVIAEPRWPRLRRLRFPLPGLPPHLSSLRILHLTDLHHGPFNSARYLRSVIARCRTLAPDLVLLTGDYVHASPRFFEPVARILGDLRPRLGTLGVLGNHDHWEDPERCRRALRGAGVRLVENTRVFVTSAALSERPVAGSLCVGGVGDLWEGRVDVAAALGGVDPATPRLLLSHNPDVAERLPAPADEAVRVDLMLSGHTHGGQVRLPLLGTPIVPSSYGDKYAAGLVRGPRFPVYVSAGLGVTILPLRFRARPEITVIELVPA
jgi:hypothetical protein